MTFGDVLVELRRRGHMPTKAKIEHAILSNKISRPDKDSSGRYVWTEYHVDQLDELFRSREAK